MWVIERFTARLLSTGCGRGRTPEIDAEVLGDESHRPLFSAGLRQRLVPRNHRHRPHESVIRGLGIGSTLVLKIGAERSNPARSDLWGAGGNPGPYRDHNRSKPPRN